MSDILKDRTADLNTSQLISSGCQCAILTVDDIPGAILIREPEQCKKSELQWWLRCRGLQVKSSSTKAHLCSIVRRHSKSNVTFTIVDPDPQNCHLIQKKINCTLCQPQLPTPSKQTTCISTYSHNKSLPLDGWTRSTDKLPASFSHIALSEHVKSSGKKQHYVEKPLDKGYKFFWDGYVHDVLCVQGDNFSFVKAKCYRSQKKNELPHSVSVKLHVHSGSVESASCSCVAGMNGYCNHVFALLYAIDHVKKMKLEQFPLHLTCTQKPAEWSKSRTEGVHAKPVMECSVVKPKYGSSSLGVQPTLYKACTKQTEDPDGKSLLTSLQSYNNNNFALFSVLNVNPPEPVMTRMGFSTPKGSVLGYQLSITEGNFGVTENTDGVNINEVTTALPKTPPPFPWTQITAPDVPLAIKVRADVNITVEGSVKLEQDTIGQSSSDKWFAERSKRITASKFGLVLQRKTKKNTLFVKNTLIGKKDLSHVPSINYGIVNERKAINQYETYMQRARNPVTVYPSGLCVNPQYPWTGASPDGKVLDKNYGFGLIEVKCSHKMRDIEPIFACDNPTFFCEKNENGLPTLKKNHPYYAQVQGQLGICGAQWCDFVVYTDKGLSIERIGFDEAYWDDMMLKIRDFYVDQMVPVICN